MKEIVILSGKGGTGKTTFTAALASLATNAVLADCDVDAPDLHLLLQPQIQHRHNFFSGHEAIIRADDCTECGLCMQHCRFDAIDFNSDTLKPEIDEIACEGCGVCVAVCEARAIDFPEALCGEWYQSKTRQGEMFHAQLGIGAENSGKLVSLVRRQARQWAEQQQAEFLLVDGPPGIGCPAIASVTGADNVVVVTEPTLSGKHDLERVLKLTKHFNVRTFVCVNKWDICEQQTLEIESLAKDYGAEPLGRLDYDKSATEAQHKQRSVTDIDDNRLASQIKEIWQQLEQRIH